MLGVERKTIVNLKRVRALKDIEVAELGIGELHKLKVPGVKILATPGRGI